VLWIFVFALNGQSASGHIAAALESIFLGILACVHVLSAIEEYGRLKARAHSAFWQRITVATIQSTIILSIGAGSDKQATVSFSQPLVQKERTNRAPKGFF